MNAAILTLALVAAPITVPEEPVATEEGVHYLNPELEGKTLTVSEGRRSFLRRASRSSTSVTIPKSP